MRDYRYPSGDLPQLKAWLADFEKREGRPLKVLHVGNIAANGYLNAKFLRRVGVEADLLVADYYHVMAFPEWEDIDLKHGHGDDFGPTFHPEDTANYDRPSWVMQGSLDECLEQANLTPRDTKGSLLRGLLRHRHVRKARETVGTSVRKAIGEKNTARLRLIVLDPKALFYIATLKTIDAVGFFTPNNPNGQPAKPIEKVTISAIAKPRSSMSALRRWCEKKLSTRTFNRLMPRARELAEQFAETFPDRPDKLTATEVLPWLVRAEMFKPLIERYDIVQYYAVEPIIGLVTDQRPYVCFEHGTLRAFTQEDIPLHRLTALAYRKADHAFITNGDCLPYAHKLGMDNFTPIIHPIDVEQHRQDFGDEVEKLRASYNADVLIFCPVRHDYKIKGTDIAIKALPRIKEQLPGKRVVMVLANWGAQVEESRAMLKKFDCEDNVAWCSTMCRVAMIKMIRASDCVLDQFVLPVFGSTAPQSIAAGKPVIASYDPAQTEWLIPEPAPIITACTPEDVAAAVVRTQDEAWLAGWKERARNWIDTYHHSDNTIADHLRAYREVLAKYELEAAPEGKAEDFQTAAQ